MKHQHPDHYYTDLIIKQVIVNEFIPDILVELFEDFYHPVTKTKDYKARRMQYHIIEELVFESVKECVHESLNDYVDE